MSESRISVLFVEDDDVDRAMFQRFVNREGLPYEYVMAETLDQARSCLAREHFDVVVTDYHLGGHTGFELLELGLDSPVIVVTGAGDEQLAVKSLQAGAYDYLVKAPGSRHLALLPLTITRAIERKQAETIAQLVHRDRSVAGYFTLDAEGHLLEANETFARILGFNQPAELLVADLWETVRTSAPLQRLIAQVMKKVVAWQVELHLTHRDGHTVYTQVNANRVPDQKPSTYRLQATVIDLTDTREAEKQRRALETQLLQSQKMEAVGQLAGGVAHDFNNLLSAIMGHSELALMALEDSPEVRDNIEHSLKASYRARDLVRQILAFSRKSEPDKKPVKVGELVNETAKLLRATLPAEVRINERYEAEDDTVFADGSQISQVLVNLGTNAAHAMPDTQGGTIEISVSRFSLPPLALPPAPEMTEGEYVRLAVQDDGCGMPEEVTSHIFEPFFTTKSETMGMGLGLSVVHGIIKSHSGEILVNSTPGEGTTFSLYLPLCDSAIVEEAAYHVITHGSNEMIALVDDEAAVVDVFSAMLRKLGYQTQTYTNGEHLLEDMHHYPGRFDLLITDQFMPAINGLTLSKAAHDLEPGLPIIMLSGRDMNLSVEEARRAGIVEFAFKPVDLMDLGMSIRRVLADGERDVRVPGSA